MKNNDPLMELIRSLNPSEKRYLKLYAARQVKGNQNKYMQVFEVLSKSIAEGDDSPEDALHRIAGSGQVSRIKTYLKQFILKSLVAYHGESNIHSQVREILSGVEVLFQKSLLSQCVRQLEKAEKLAREHELFLVLAEIVDWKLKLEIDLKPGPEIDQSLQKNRDEVVDQFEKWLNNRDYGALGLRMHRRSLVHGQSNSRTPIYDDPLLANPDAALSVRAKLRFHRLAASGYLADFRYDKAVMEIRSMLDIFESNAQLLRFRYPNYLSTLRNMVLVCRFDNRFSEATQYVKQLQARTIDCCGDKLSSGSINEHIAGVNSLLDLSKDTGDLGPALEQIKRVEPAIRRYRSYIAPANLRALEYLGGIVEFLRGNFSQSARSFYALTVQSEGKVRTDLQLYARLLLMLSHYEIGNLEVVEKELKSSLQFVKDRSIPFRLPVAVLRLFESLVKLPFTGCENRKQLQCSLAEFDGLNSDAYQRKAFYYFDFRAWVQARLNRQPITDVLNLKLDPVGSKSALT